MTITFNRVDKKNSITADMYGAMADALQAAAGRRRRARGGVPGPRNHLQRRQRHWRLPEQAARGRELAGVPLPARHCAFPKPLIAAVCGPAVGVGTTMLFHCDLVYAGDNAAFSMPFVNLGLCPEAASSLLVPQMLGYHRAAEALLMGEPFMAEAALEVGLVNRVLPPTEANNYAQAQARKLAAKPISALVETKRLMKKGQATLVAQQQMAEEGASFGRMLGEPAAKEAFTAFMERRKPDFSV
jgi:enoyl-CoA hydratase/carnithine racemase